MPVQLDAVEDHGHTRLHLRAQYGQCGESDTTRSAGACGSSVVRCRFALDDVGPAAKGAVQVDHLVRVRTLLRRIDARRAQRAIQRVVDVAGESE
jgi:hypothetical protein